MPLFKKNHTEEHWKKALKLQDPFRKEYNLREAISHFQRAISEDPTHYHYRFDLGRAYLNTPNLAVTRGVNVEFKLEDAVKLAIPEFKEAARLEPKFDPCYLNLAHCYLIEGDKKEAVTWYTEYLKVKKEKLDKAEERLQNMEYAIMKRRKPVPEPDKATEHLRQARLYRDEGRYKKAAKELEKAYAIAPDVPWVYKKLYQLGR